MSKLEYSQKIDNAYSGVQSDSLLDNLIGYALKRAHVHLNKNLVSKLGEYELRPSQFAAMVIIKQNPGLMQAELGAQLSIEPPQVVTLINKLENLGLAMRVRCKPDKRSYGVFLSKAGERLLEQLKVAAKAIDIGGTVNLSENERAELLRLLRKIYQ
ncbi:MarR family winged helix-turn-helix transcriptional regulator [Marinobacterium rhizophilum]|uniref:MarR family winged helix-turn-helix transcriptional regulator n=1 Tax=Marinobacterium rhizophilum TaxID=420402 RepID=UPI00037B497B|nr:MarR family transcriptional regulator [Marinobacterium rhizophilum]